MLGMYVDDTLVNKPGNLDMSDCASTALFGNL